MINGKKKYSRTPYAYNGSKLTSHALQDILPHIVERLNRTAMQKPQKVIEAWQEMVDPRFASMTRAVRFENRVLYVLVKNSTVLSLLSVPQDKERIVALLRQKFQGVQIDYIQYKLG